MKGTKHSSYGQSNYRGIPDRPTLHFSEFISAVGRATQSGDIQGEYTRLSSPCKHEFSFATFERRVQNGGK